MPKPLLSLLIQVRQPLIVVWLCSIGTSVLALLLPWCVSSLQHNQTLLGSILVYFVLFESMVLAQQWLTAPLFNIKT